MRAAFVLIVVLVVLVEASIDPSACPRACSCHHLTVDCSARGLTAVPRDLPRNAVDVSVLPSTRQTQNAAFLRSRSLFFFIDFQTPAAQQHHPAHDARLRLDDATRPAVSSSPARVPLFLSAVRFTKRVVFRFGYVIAVESRDC